jgi:hypothetical protein
MHGSTIPHLRIVVAVSAFVLGGFAMVSGYVIGWSADEVTKGNIIGTWQNFALLAVGFWLGSSSAGKAKDEPSRVQIDQPPNQPVPVEEAKP